MKTVRELMTTDVVWISPSARVKTAVILMKGHNVGALPVVQPDETVVGIVTQLDVLGEPPDTLVADVMQRDFVSVAPDTPAIEAAEKLSHARASLLVVVENDRLVGAVWGVDLIPELGKNFDPLTGLQWSDSFREWATAALKRGVEISVIFFDLDRFGEFNKNHGHVVGDNVIKEVAEVVKSGIDPAHDFACRYGGDEFVVVSSRKHDDAKSLADSIKEGIGRIRIPGVAEAVSGTYGIFGGRRTKEREDIHYVATIDDLITRASKNCTAAKPGRIEPEVPAALPAAVQPAPAAAPARLKIKNVTISTTETEVRAAVTLSRGDREHKGESSGVSSGGTAALRIVAEAAAKAARESVPEGHQVVVEDVSTHKSATDDEVVSVVTTFIGPRWEIRHVGSAVVRRGDHYRAAVAALLASVNRLLEPHEG